MRALTCCICLDTCSTQTEYELLIASIGNDRMVQFLWRNDSTHYQPLHTQASFHVLARIPHMDASVADGKLEILAYVRVETHARYGGAALPLSCPCTGHHGYTVDSVVQEDT